MKWFCCLLLGVAVLARAAGDVHVGAPEKLDTLRAADVPLIARRALDEAQGFYPVPRFMNQSECEAVLRKLLP